ncbi:E3 ubiquitin-protein ligase RMA3 [Spatholobus suberectus]|nr:E3 ubiquitin-protein ligase RMA3 [Spatholobus suberectus]
MEEETSDAMNLDLNLGPGPEPETGPISNEAVNLDDWIGEPRQRISEAVRFRARQRWRWQHLPLPHVHIPTEAARHFQIPPEAHNMSVELNQFLVNSGNGSALQAGEGSVVAEERMEEAPAPKACENVNGVAEDEALQKKDDVEKGSGNDGDFFDCNICLDLARDPVVTCCGHLFCWPCLYRWLHLHSDAKECPVCKGEVTLKSVTPIYGRGNNARVSEEDSALKIPPRPHARRVESLRQTIQRNAFALPVEEMIRRLGSRIDLTRDLVQPHEPDNARETAERTTSLLSRFLTARGMRREQNLGAPQEDVMGLTQNNVNTSEAGDNPGRVQSILLRRTQSHRATLSTLSSALTSAERLVEAYFRSNPLGRNQEQPPPPPVDDRDSFSSIGAVINSESQVDTAVEIDSMVSLSTSSSRRRNDASRVSDVDSGDSRAPRRRRLN